MKIILFLSVWLTISKGNFIVDPGPKIKPTVGEIWPKPYFTELISENYYILISEEFKFDLNIDEECPILDGAIDRYTNIIKNAVNSLVKHDEDSLSGKDGIGISSIEIEMRTSCEHIPYLNMDESYELNGSGKISANTVWGVLRGLETFSQLLTPLSNYQLHIPDIKVIDAPRFSHRGLLIDTSRHFLRVDVIYKVLDAMAYNKLNVFHWHIVDDQSFPYQSTTFPNLTKGAYFPEMIYSQNDIVEIIEYARLRGIRIIPEFDIPGHTRSWGVGHPEILTECKGEYEGKLGPINPIQNNSYEFIKDLFEEVQNVFPDKYFHMGGDEVAFNCWESNEDIKEYVKNKKIDYKQLQQEFMEKAINFIESSKDGAIVWQEAMEGDAKMPDKTVVHVWLGDWKQHLQNYISKGFRGILSECWYLSSVNNGGDWERFYDCEPSSFTDDEEVLAKLLGGEACTWGEFVNNQNVVSRTFPRASAVAEKLWSTKDADDIENVRKRLEEHTCRMILRGISAQPPNESGFC